MSTSFGALLLVLVASLVWSGVDTSRKVLASHVQPIPLLFAQTLAAAPLFAIWLAVDGMPAVLPGYLVPAVTSVALNIVANLAFLMALQISPLSVTIPLLSLTPVFTTLLAIPLLGERPTLLQGLGILLVVAGAFGLNLAAEDGFSFSSLWRSWVREKGALWMVVVAFFWSLTVPLDKLALEHSSGPFHGLVLNGGVALGMLIALLWTRRLPELADVRRVRGTFVLCVLLSALALALQLKAIQIVWVGLVETLKRGIGNLSAVLFGRLLFAEPITLRKLLTVLLMGIGVALILS
jgi:drug/metabolite transporter (DMT)-like permease